MPIVTASSTASTNESPIVVTSSSSSMTKGGKTPRRRRAGAKHTVEGTTGISADSIASPQDIQTMVHKVQSNRDRLSADSKQHELLWRHWCTQAVDAIRYHLSQNLPDPADPHEFGALFFELGEAADNGEMPSFADAGARSGYALEFFCRARLMADLMLDNYDYRWSPVLWRPEAPQNNEELRADVWKEKVGGSSQCSTHPDKINTNDTTNNSVAPEEEKVMRIVSLGGGPGYDFVGLVLADTFGTSGYGTTRIEGTVFDYEEGWGPLVDAMNIATQSALEINNTTNQHVVTWGGGCDITKSMSHPSNAACRATLPSTDMFVCQYCLAENAAPLRDSDFRFFVDLFEQAANDTVFIITEVTSRIWPELLDILLRLQDQQQNTRQQQDLIGFDVDFVRTKKRKFSPAMVIQKRLGAKIRQEEMDECQDFIRLRTLHERKMEKGYKRECKKVRGCKVP